MSKAFEDKIAFSMAEWYYGHMDLLMKKINEMQLLKEPDGWFTAVRSLYSFTHAFFPKRKEHYLKKFGIIRGILSDKKIIMYIEDYDNGRTIWKPNIPKIIKFHIQRQYDDALDKLFFLTMDLVADLNQVGLLAPTKKYIPPEQAIMEVGE